MNFFNLTLFCSREYYEKDNIDFLTDLDPEEVFYRQKVTLIFDRERSVGSLSDEITTLNIIGAVRNLF